MLATEDRGVLKVWYIHTVEYQTVIIKNKFFMYNYSTISRKYKLKKKVLEE